MAIAPTPWQDLIRLIVDGQSVNAQQTNQPTADLAQRTQHLKDLLDLMAASETLYVRGVPVDEDVEVGQPVYLNDVTSRFEKAIVALDLDADNVWGVPAKSSYTWGIVIAKQTNTIADVATAGILRDMDISNALRTGDTDVTGAYFLSAREAGKIERVRSPAAAFLLYHWKEEGLTLLMPDASVGMLDHVHYRFQLTASPAGQPNNPEIGFKHSIVAANPALSGWLPADDDVFQSMAPAGAKFGYNLAQDAPLATVFPPLPLESFFLEVFGDGWGTGREPNEVIVVDANGIWWMRDDFGWAPWSIDYWNCESSSSSPAPEEGSEVSERPPPVDQQELHGYVPHDGSCYEMSIFLWFTKLASKTNDGVVASLTPCEGSPITILDCNCEEAASSGHLRLGLNLDLGTGAIPVAGGTVLKSVVGTTFQSGWVAEGLKSSNTAIQLTGDHVSDDGYVQGKVLISFVDPNTNDRELDVLLTALDNAAEETLFDIMYLGFRPARDASIRGKIEVPSGGFDSEVTYVMALRFWILGTVAGTLPNLTMTYRRISRSLTPASLPVAETGGSTLALNTITVGQNQYIEVETDEFVIVGGDSVFFTLARDSSDGYTGNVGILRQKGIVRPQP
ncbi:MAG TPA: hypothetical protein ENH11_01700 [Candidatus Acetothermia bacterium]|nr:hypothetical protein [Candidatus Acetothermia bacterium]